jgi:hypothetical protein
LPAGQVAREGERNIEGGRGLLGPPMNLEAAKRGKKG